MVVSKFTSYYPLSELFTYWKYSFADLIIYHFLVDTIFFFQSYSINTGFLLSLLDLLTKGAGSQGEKPRQTPSKKPVYSSVSLSLRKTSFPHPSLGLFWAHTGKGQINTINPLDGLHIKPLGLNENKFLIPWLQSMGSQRVGHNWVTKHSTAIPCMQILCFQIIQVRFHLFLKILYIFLYLWRNMSNLFTHSVAFILLFHWK